LPSLIRAWNLKNITATDFTLNRPGVKRLGLHYKHFGTPLPLLKRLRGRFAPKNSAFWRRVEKVGLDSPEAKQVIGAIISNYWLRLLLLFITDH
jgi:hypothetical protein